MTQQTKLDVRDCGCPGCSFWLQLEAERNSLAWKIGRGSAELQNPRRRTGNKQDKRDLLMFNAGRFSAGARDIAAQKANQQFLALMGDR